MRFQSRLTKAAIAAAATALVVATAGNTAATVTSHTGSGRPALSLLGSTLWVAWTGSTGPSSTSKALNIGWTTDGGATVTKIANTETLPVDEGPALDSDGTGVYVAWPGTDSAHTLNIAYIIGGAETCKTTLTGLTSSHSPALVHNASGTRYLAWTDGSGHLEFSVVSGSSCGTSGSITHSTPLVVTDTASGPPALVDDTTSAGLGIVVGWAGTDPSHQLSTATFDATTTLKNKVLINTSAGTAATSNAAFGLAADSADLYLEYQGTNGHLYTGFSEGCVPACFAPADQGTPIAFGPGLVSGSPAWNAYFDASGHLDISSF